jgi:hypothetical protein
MLNTKITPVIPGHQRQAERNPGPTREQSKEKQSLLE